MELEFPDRNEGQQEEELPSSSLYMQKGLGVDPESVHHGTTTLTFIYAGGIIVAADSRASSGKFVGNEKADKVFEINAHTLGTMAGVAADCCFWSRALMKENYLHEIRFNKRMTITACAEYLFKAATSIAGVHIGMIISGVDRDDGQFKIFSVNRAFKRQVTKKITVGSGSQFARGMLDVMYSWDMDDAYAVDMAKRCIYFAAFRDSFSGGSVTVYHIKTNGWVKVCQTDLHELTSVYETQGGFYP